MDSLLFIALLACPVLVILWFVENHEDAARGARGLLAIRPDDTGDSIADDTPTYSVKSDPAKRLRARPEFMSEAGSDTISPAFAPRGKKESWRKRVAEAYRRRRTRRTP
jgi:hypothetical protein